MCVCFKRRSSNRWFSSGCSTMPHHDAVVLPMLRVTVNLDPTQSVKSDMPSHQRWHSIDQSCHNFITMMAAIHQVIQRAAIQIPMDQHRRRGLRLCHVAFHPLEGNGCYQPFASWVSEDIFIIFKSINTGNKSSMSEIYL